MLADFNNLDVSKLLSSHSLKQVVSKPTRGVAILDLIITNLYKFYETHVITAPLGSSDHNTVLWSPASTTSNRSNKCTKRLARRFSWSGINGFGLWAVQNNWFTELRPNPSVDKLAQSFTSQVTDALDRFLPMKPIRFHSSDKPWITPRMKQLIKERQSAYHSGNVHQWRDYRYKVQREIDIRKKTFYADKVKQLPKNDCRGWWKIINTLSGRTNQKSSFSLQRNDQQLTDDEIVNSLNRFFVSVNADIPPIDLKCLPTYLPAADDLPVIQNCKCVVSSSNFKPLKRVDPITFHHVFLESIT